MNNLSELKNKIKEWWGRHWFDVLIFIIIVLVATAFLGLWRLSETRPDKAPIYFTN